MINLPRPNKIKRGTARVPRKTLTTGNIQASIARSRDIEAGFGVWFASALPPQLSVSALLILARPNAIPTIVKIPQKT